MQFRLPWPPTANKIWRTGPHGTYLSPDYKTFLGESQLAWYEQGRPRIIGQLTVHLYLFPPDSRAYDVDNRIKPTLDAMTKIGLWEDDRVVKKISATKCSPVPHGAVIAEIYLFEEDEIPDPEDFGLKKTKPKESQNDSKRTNDGRNPTQRSDRRNNGIGHRGSKPVPNAAQRLPAVTRRGIANT